MLEIAPEGGEVGSGRSIADVAIRPYEVLRSLARADAEPAQCEPLLVLQSASPSVPAEAVDGDRVWKYAGDFACIVVPPCSERPAE
jgi:hypothetical protein